MDPSEEVGVELSIPELRALIEDGPRVVVVGREDRDLMMTLWCIAVGTETAIFMGKPEGRGCLGFMAFIEGERLVDDSGKKILVHDFLGTVEGGDDGAVNR